MLEVTFYDISGGDDKEIIGPFESIQMSGTILRDQDDNIIARFFDGVWFSEKYSGNGWYDWTVSEVKDG